MEFNSEGICATAKVSWELNCTCIAVIIVKFKFIIYPKKNQRYSSKIWETSQFFRSLASFYPVLKIMHIDCQMSNITSIINYNHFFQCTALFNHHSTI